MALTQVIVGREYQVGVAYLRFELACSLIGGVGGRDLADHEENQSPAAYAAECEGSNAFGKNY